MKNEYKYLKRRTDIHPEPTRDWNIGLVTGHRLSVIAYICLGIIVLYAIQHILWPSAKAPHTIVENLWSWGSLLWI